MKTLIKFVHIVFIFSFLSSCETDVPEVDNTPPTFNLRISGDGFSRDFTQADIYDSFQLNLNSESEYTIVLSASDQGGVRRTTLQWFTEGLQLTSEIPAGWSISTSGFSTYLEWEGDSANPLTGNIFIGDFIAHAGQFDLSTGQLRVSVNDYGGDSRASNSTYADLNLLIGYDIATEVIPF